jgi:hypothetical protein
MQLPPDAARGLALLEDGRPCDPDSFVSGVTDFVDFVRYSSAQDQQKIREQLEPKHFARLRGYASRMASRAVQRGSVEDVERGLAASAFEGGRFDYRYTVITLCLLHRSAEKLGVNVDELFQRAASLGDKASKELLLGYLARGDKRLEAMGYKEGVGEDGRFKYVADGW